MNGQINYKTKQKDAILGCIKKFGDRHFTIDELFEALKDSGCSVGKTTIYRNIEKFMDEGIVRKYNLSEKDSACFQYVNDSCCEHFHLKCVSCGRLIHADCDFLKNLSEHIKNEHEFVIDNSRTVFYGKCRECINGGGKK